MTPRLRQIGRLVRRLVWAAGATAMLVVLTAPPASAHPLGNFTQNVYAGLRVQPGRLVIDYVVDLAEIPAYQARRGMDHDHDDRVDGTEAAEYRDDGCRRHAEGIHVTTSDGRSAVTVDAARLTFPPGAGGLATLRLECTLSADLHDVTALTFSDTAFAGRLGWHEITAVGSGTRLLASDVPATSASARLTRYPQDLLGSPLERRTATLRFVAGGQGAAAADASAVGPTDMRPRGVDRLTLAFTGLIARQRLTVPFLALAVLAALVLGGLHALAPGHGKTIMAGYLLGVGGRRRDAAVIALTVTATHTAGVLALGMLVTLTSTVAPERLYPWLGVGSGLLALGIGVGLLRRAMHRGAREHKPRQAGSAAAHHHAGAHSHPHPHAHGNDHTQGHSASLRSLIPLGFAGGLVPSPSALVVLLAALALHRAWFGLLLVIAYGAGMALTLSGAGLLLVRTRALAEKLASARDGHGPRLAAINTALPVVAAAVIIVSGALLVARGVAGL